MTASDPTWEQLWSEAEQLAEHDCALRELLDDAYGRRFLGSYRSPTYEALRAAVERAKSALSSDVCDDCLHGRAIAQVGEVAVCAACLDERRAIATADTLPAPANDVARAS